MNADEPSVYKEFLAGEIGYFDGVQSGPWRGLLCRTDSRGNFERHPTTKNQPRERDIRFHDRFSLPPSFANTRGLNVLIRLESRSAWKLLENLATARSPRRFQQFSARKAPRILIRSPSSYLNSNRRSNRVYSTIETYHSERFQRAPRIHRGTRKNFTVHGSLNRWKTGRRLPRRRKYFPSDRGKVEYDSSIIEENRESHSSVCNWNVGSFFLFFFGSSQRIPNKV